MDYNGLQMDYDGLRWITMDYDGLRWITMDCTIVVENCFPISELYLEAVFLLYLTYGQRHAP